MSQKSSYSIRCYSWWIEPLSSKEKNNGVELFVKREWEEERDWVEKEKGVKKLT